MSKRGGRREGAGRPVTGAKPSLTVRIPEELKAKLIDTAENEGLSASAYIQKMLEAELPE
jgi:predicted HicB family RNase H-like nuclease